MPVRRPSDLPLDFLVQTAYRLGRWPIGTDVDGFGNGIDCLGSGSCRLQTWTMQIVPANPAWSGSGGSPPPTYTRLVASILHWMSSSPTCWQRMTHPFPRR